MKETQFPLAPMSLLIWILTIIAFTIPLLICMAIVFVPPEYRLIPLFLTAFNFLIFAGIRLWCRPLYFGVDSRHLQIVWPLRHKSFDLSNIASAEFVSGREFRKKYGYGIRVGAGGVWGAFGMFITRQRKFQLYISRTDWVVVVHLKEGRPLIITPEDPQKFVAMLRVSK